MEIRFSNAKQTFLNQGLDILNNDDINSISNKIIIVFPYLQSWWYDEATDHLCIQCLVVLPSTSVNLGGVTTDGFIIG
jgi:hypothetical protein